MIFKKKIQNTDATKRDRTGWSSQVNCHLREPSVIIKFCCYKIQGYIHYLERQDLQKPSGSSQSIPLSHHQLERPPRILLLQDLRKHSRNFSHCTMLFPLQEIVIRKIQASSLIFKIFEMHFRFLLYIWVRVDCRPTSQQIYKKKTLAI